MDLSPEDIVFKKRRMMGLKDVTENSPEFLSDLRHLIATSAFCDLHYMDEGDNKKMRFLNLELRDHLEAKTLQMKFEAEQGIPHGGTADIIDKKANRLIEITFTSGSMAIARSRKRAANRNTEIIVFREDCSEVESTNGEYGRMARECLPDLKLSLSRRGLDKVINSKGAIKEDFEIKYPPITKQVTDMIDEMIIEGSRDGSGNKRTFESVVNQVAEIDYHLSRKGCKPTKYENTDGKYRVWVSPPLRHSNGVEYVEGPFGHRTKEFLDSVRNSTTYGGAPPMETTISMWINERKYRIENSECVFSEKDSLTEIFGEKVRKESISFVGAASKGDSNPKRSEERTRRRAIGLHPEWSVLFDKTLKDKDWSNGMLNIAYQYIRSLGNIQDGLHRGTTMRIIRPLVVESKILGLVFKPSSKAKDTEREAKHYLIAFQDHPDGTSKNCYFHLTDGTSVPWYVTSVFSRSKEVTARITADSSLLWVSEIKGKYNTEDNDLPMIDPVNRRMVFTDVEGQIRWSKLRHVEELWKPSAIQEDLSAMCRKLGECARAKADDRQYGAVGGFKGMCEAVEKDVSIGYTSNCFIMAGIAHVITTFLSATK